MATLERYLREPLSALTHFVAGLLALGGAGVLVFLSRGDVGKMMALLVYGVSLVVLFTASTMLHGLKVRYTVQRWLNRVDHMAIFLLIAGTYTPIVYHYFSPGVRTPILILVWTVAVAGMAFKLLSRHIDNFFSVVIYVLLAWGGAIPLISALPMATLPAGGLALLVLGGLIYSAGFVIYYTRRPDPWPRVFGHHEIWHLCVIGGSLCHYLFMLRYIVL
ncbi:MAG: PAQR family membrane homeostasis protein TrhA [Chloroflexota bacterium]